ncbi:MAG: PIN domain-containing protein [Acidobacteria bacterium]|nr:MAG: PIN domain-containing protein [Acidobacteriota bacterium]
MLVVDASFVIGAVMVPEGLGRLRRHQAVAPELLWSEVTSALHSMLWRRAISAELAEAARATVARAPIARHSHAQLRQEAWAIAERLGWAKTYDAEYVALARLIHCPLLTVDARLARGAAAEVEMLSPFDL